MTQRLVSVCCEAEPVEVDAVSNGAGQCSRCKKNTTFEPDTWTRPLTADEIIEEAARRARP